jgi:hypothetical protein
MATQKGNLWEARKPVLAYLYERAGEQDENCAYTDPCAVVRAGAYCPATRERTGLSDEVIGEITALAEREGLIGWEPRDDRGDGIWLRLMAWGIRSVEEAGFVPADQAEQRETAALAILRYADERHHCNGKHHRIDVWDLLDAGGKAAHARRALAVLVQEHGFIEHAPGWAYEFRITTLGREYLARLDEEQAVRNELLRRFEEIESLKPQARGLALQTLIADAIRHQGYDCHEDQGGLGEQIDLVICVSLTYFVGEAKWEAEPIQGGVIDQMVGRMARRPNFYVGIVFSMSRFTEGSGHNLVRVVGTRTILLLGREDILALIRFERDFAEIVGERLRCLATGEEDRSRVKRPRARKGVGKRSS